LSKEISEKNRKLNCNWEQTTVSCEVASNLISVPKEFLFTAITAPNTGKHTGNFTEILRKHFVIIEG